MDKITRKEFIENIKNTKGGVALVGAVHNKTLNEIITAIDNIDNRIKYTEDGALLDARTLKEVSKAMDKIVWSNDSELRLNGMAVYKYYASEHCYLIARNKDESYPCTCVYVCHKNG